jgi:polar amino acid transport system substrate-binding protein
MIRRLSALLLLLLLGSSCTRTPENQLRVGMELSYPPFEMTDERGNPAGVSVDLAHALGDALHRPVQIQDTPFDGLLPSLKTGKIDLIVSSMTATPERAQSIDFSDPYLSTGLALLVGAKSDVKSIDDLDKAGRTVVVKNATTGHLYAQQHLKAPHVLVLDQESACVLEVAQGKADAFIYDQMSILKHWKQNPETTRALLTPFQKEQWAIAVRKGNDELRQQVNAFLKDFRAGGGFDRLSDRWLKSQKEDFEKLGVPFVF